MLNIRPANKEDQVAILEIYNHAILNTSATFDTVPRTHEMQMEWFLQHKENHPVLVAEEENEIIGWASLSPYNDRCAYDTTVEVSVYVHPDHQGKGIGSRLLQIVTLEGGKKKNHTVISRITEGNAVSIHLHEKIGYRHIGVMKEVGYKFGKFLDVYLMQYLYSSSE